MALFESYERREKQILAKLAEYGINSIEEAAEVTKAAGLDVYKMIEGIQPICFENAKWAYTVGAAIAIKKGCRKASEAAAAIGEGLQSFCIPGSVADQRWSVRHLSLHSEPGLRSSLPDHVSVRQTLLWSGSYQNASVPQQLL